jgi:hypothetical protein
MDGGGRLSKERTMLAHWKRQLAASTALTTIMLASAASADVITLGAPNAALAPYPGPYGQVTYTFNEAAQTASFTFSRLNGYMIIDGQSAALNINSTSYSVVGGTGGVSYTQDAGFNTASATNITTTGQNVSDFGSFNLVIDSFDGFGAAATSLSFVVHNDSLTLWDSIDDVLIVNSDDFLAAGHFAACGAPPGVPCTSAFTSSGVVNTGFAANSGPPVPPPQPPPVPEPATVALFGTALIALALTFGRRRRPFTRE